MQPRTRAQRQRDAAAAAGGPGADEAIQREWAAQRERQQQQKVIERLQDQEQNLRQLEDLAGQEGNAGNFELQRQLQQQRAAFEREQQVHNVQLPRPAAQRAEKPPETGIPRPAAFGGGGAGLFGAPAQGQPGGGGLFGVGPGEAPAPAPGRFFGEAPSAAPVKTEHPGPPQMFGNGQGAGPADNVPPWLAGPAQARPAPLNEMMLGAPAQGPAPGYAPGPSPAAAPAQVLSSPFAAPAPGPGAAERRDDNYQLRREEFMRRRQQQQQAAAPNAFGQEPSRHGAPLAEAHPSPHQAPPPGGFEQQFGGIHAPAHAGPMDSTQYGGAPPGQYQQAPQGMGWMGGQQQQPVGMHQQVSFAAPSVEMYQQEPGLGTPRQLPSAANRPPTGFVHGVAPDSPSRGVIPMGDTAPRDRQMDAKLAYGEELRRQAEEDRMRQRENKLPDKPQWLNPSSPQGQQHFGQGAAPDGMPPHWQHEQLSRPVHQANLIQQPQQHAHAGSVLPMGDTAPKNRQLDAKLAYGEELRRQAEEDKLRRKGHRLPDKPQWMSPSGGDQRAHWQHEQLAAPVQSLPQQQQQHQQHQFNQPWPSAPSRGLPRTPQSVESGGGMFAGLGEDRSREQKKRQQQEEYRNFLLQQQQQDRNRQHDPGAYPGGPSMQPPLAQMPYQAAAEMPANPGPFAMHDNGRPPVAPSPMGGPAQAYGSPYGVQPTPSFAPQQVKASGLADFGQNSGVQDERRRKQQQMNDMLAQQVAEAQRRKEEAKRKQKEEEEREMERIRRDQAEEAARLEAEKAKEEERKRQLEEERKQAVEEAQARKRAAEAAAAAEDAKLEAAAKAASTPQSRPGTRENRRQKRVGIKEGDDPPAPPPFVQSGNNPAGPRADLFGSAPGDEPPVHSDLFGPPPDAPAPARADLFGPPPDAPAPARADLFGPPPTSGMQPGAQSTPPWQQSQHRSTGPVEQFGGANHGGSPFGAANPGSAPPGNEWLNGIMQQQQELYRQQQDALARLQDESDRLRQEKEDAQNNLLELKTKQLEEKEREVRKLQKKFQRQVLLQGGAGAGAGAASSSLDAALDVLLPDAAATGSSSPSNGREENSYGPGAFYSKYEQEPPAANVPGAAQQSLEKSSENLERAAAGRAQPWTRGVQAQEAEAKVATSQTSGLEDGWSVAPLPWEEDKLDESVINAAAAPEFSGVHSRPDAGRAQANLLGVGAPGAAEVPRSRRHSMQDSLFEDSWGPALSESMVEGAPRIHEPPPLPAKDPAASTSISASFGATLVGDSKLVCAADAANRTWRDGQAPRLQNSARFQNSMASMGSELQASTRPVALSFSEHQDAAVRASDLFSPSALAPTTAVAAPAIAEESAVGMPAADAVESASEPLGPMAELEAAVRAIREARGDFAGAPVTGLSVQLSTSHGLEDDLAAASLGARSMGTDLGGVGQVESPDRGTLLGAGTLTFGSTAGGRSVGMPGEARPDVSSDSRQETGASWGKVLRQFGGDNEDVARPPFSDGLVGSPSGQFTAGLAGSPSEQFTAGHGASSLAGSPSGQFTAGHGASGTSGNSRRRRRVSEETNAADASSSSMDRYIGNVGNSQDLNKPADVAGAAVADSLDMFQAGSDHGSAGAQEISVEDFAAIASEDFDTFISRLQKKADGVSPAAGALPSGGMLGASPSAAAGAAAGPLRPGSGGAYSSRPPVAVPQRDPLANVPGSLRRDRVRTGSPILRGAASSVLRSGSMDARPLSGSSAGSRPGSASKMPSLKELRQQRRKPRTVEDVALPGLSTNADDAAVSIADGGLGLRLNATATEHRNSCPEPGSLQALRAARPPSRERQI